jgi:hypothetical protein
LVTRLDLLLPDHGGVVHVGLGGCQTYEKQVRIYRIYTFR